MADYLYIDFVKYLKHGFYFDEYNQLIKCSHCNLKFSINNLETITDIESIHREISPHCKFYEQENRNIPLNETILKGLLKDYFLAGQYTFIKLQQQKISILIYDPSSMMSSNTSLIESMLSSSLVMNNIEDKSISCIEKKPTTSYENTIPPMHLELAVNFSASEEPKKETSKMHKRTKSFSDLSEKENF